MRTNATAAAGMVGLLLLAACSGSGQALDHPATGAPSGEPTPRAAEEEVPTWTAGPGTPLSVRLRLESRLVTEADLLVQSRAGGLVEEVFVDRGERVTKGQVLARFERREQELRHEAARAELRRARGVEERREILLKEDLVPKEEHQAAIFEREIAEAALALTDYRLEMTEVRSPLDGIVTERHVRPGMTVQEGVPLFRVVGSAPPQARVYLAEWAAPYVTVGQPVSLLPTFGGEAGPGRVAWVSPVIDPVAGTVEVRVGPQGPPRVLLGASVVVEFQLISGSGRPIVPRSSLSESDPVPGGEATLWVDEEGRWRPRTVRLGLVGEEEAEVRGGLREGELYRAAPPAR